MKKNKMILGIMYIVVATIIIDCASLDIIPDPLGKLYDEKDEIMENGGIAVVAEVTSARRDLARRKLSRQGRTSLAFALKSKIEAISKNFADEATDIEGSEINETFMEVSKNVASETIQGSAIIGKPVFFKDKDNPQKIFCGGIVGISPKLLETSMLDNLKNNPKLYTRFRSSKAFEELEKEIKKYEVYKKDNKDLP